MFGVFNSLVKATVAVVATPVAVIADVVTLPISAYEDESPFNRTEKMLEAVGKNITDAVDPNK